MKLVKDLQVGDVFRVNGDNFEVIDLQPAHKADAWNMRYQSQSSGRTYTRFIWFVDELRII